MRAIQESPFNVFAGALLCAASSLLFGAMAVQAQQFAPTVRIVERIDEGRLVPLKGNTHPAANAHNDRGRVSPELPMTDLILVLSRDPRQQAAFDSFVAAQYDSASPSFHHWLTPEEVGRNFGPSETDIATISRWLTGHGFSVDEVSNDRMSIRFSGTAAQVESAFHTEMHKLEVKGVQHIGNMSDPQIPAALAPAVVGVKSLHDFFPKPLHRMGEKVSRDAATGKWKPSADASRRATARPRYTTTDSNNDLLEDVGPYDFAAIYNVSPLWKAGIDGSGQTIAVAGTSDINLADVTSFRGTFGLPTYTSANQPQQKVVHGPDPGDCSAAAASCVDDLIENTLDVEWSGAVAPGAQIILAVSGATSATDDTVWDSANYVVQNQSTLKASILNVSYGLCELGEGTAGNVSYYDLWQTAYAEGIAVFVAAGDSASAACDEGLDTSLPYAAEYGLSVSGLASTPFNTAVGGTDLNWGSTAAPYWGATNNTTTKSNALGYIPEVPWNDTCASAPGAAYLYWVSQPAQTDRGGVVDAESACNFVLDYYQLIAYYDNVDLSGFVDIVGGSGGKSGCIVSDSADVSSCLSSTTTTGAANGSIPLVNDGWPKPIWQANVAGIPADGVRDIPDVSFFAADGFLGSAYLICVSADASCTYSSQTEPLAQEVGGTSVATPAMAGVMALINQKTGAIQGNPNTELYALAAKQSYSSCSAETVTNSSSCFFNDIDAGNITVDGKLLVNSNSVPCDFTDSSPNCAILYSGDEAGILGVSAGNPGYQSGTGYDLATGLGSLNVANVVNGFAGIGNHPATVTVAPASASITTNQSLSVTVTVAAAYAGGPTPTGTVTLTGGGYNSGAQMLNASGIYVFNIPANTFTSGGIVTLTASYGADANYAPATGTASVTVVGPTFTLSQPAVSPSSVAPGSSATATVTVSSVYGYTGTATLSCTPEAGNPLNEAGDAPTCTTTNGTNVAMGATASFTVNTFAAGSAALVYPQAPGKGRGWGGAGGGAVLALLFFLGIPARRRSWRAMVGLLILTAALGTLSACGGGGGGSSTTGNPGTQPGSYTFTVTGTGNPSVTPTVSTSFTVTVK